MTLPKRSVRDVLLASGAILFAGIARLLLDPFLGDHFPYLTFFIAVAVSALYGGLWPSVMAVALSAIAANWFFMPPRYSFEPFTDTAHLVGFLTYITLGLGLVAFGQALQRTKHRVETALEALSEREARLGIAMEGADLGAWEIDLQTGRTSWDERMPALLGVPPEHAADAAITWAGMIHPEDRPRVLEELRAAMETGAKYETECRVIRTDGTVRWFASRGKIVASADGGTRRMVGMVQDITDRKQAADILQESEERLRLAAEGAKLGLWFWDVKKKALIWTGQCKEMFGLPLDAVVTYDRFLECLHPDDRARTHAAVLQSHGDGTPYDIEYRVVWPDGTVHWIAAKGHSQFDEQGALARMHGIVLNIDARKGSEDALRLQTAQIAESEERFRTLADHMSQFAWTADADGSVTWYNRRWYDYTGTAFEDMQGWGWRKVHHPDHLDRVVAKWKRAHQTGEVWEDTFPLRSREGEYRWFLSRALPIRDAQGTVVRWFGTNTDVTEQRNAEAALRESEERLRSLAGRLEQLVAERTEELVHSQQRLRALATELNLIEQRERKRLATDLHDHLAQLLVLARLKLSQTKRLPDVGAGCQSLIQETEKVLDESLSYTRTLVADLAPPILHDVGLAAALKWLGQHMADRGLKVTVQIGDTPPILSEEHAVLLFQSVRELLMNTLKHAETGHAVVTFAQQDGDLLIEVGDEGKGIDLPALAAASAAPDASLKFGLFSIRERMRSLGGRFDLESVPGKGTTATLVLPLASRSEAGSRFAVRGSNEGSEVQGSQFESDGGEHRTPNLEANQQRPNRIRVLLVDDHAMVRQGLRTVLDAYPDLDVVGEAANGEEAVALAERLRPSLVVMDINMPKKNGIEATAEITARFPAIVVIGLSVQANREAQDAMLNAGAAALLTKEAAVEQLYEAIRQALEQSGQRCAAGAEPAGVDERRTASKELLS